MDFPAAEDRAAACTALADTVHDQARVSDYLVIDTPGHDSYLTRLAHTMADTLITPLNDSFVDLDVLATVDPATLAVTGTSHYSQMVEDARSQRQLLDNVLFDWIVLRNRLSNLGSRNKRLVGDGLARACAAAQFPRHRGPRRAGHFPRILPARSDRTRRSRRDDAGHAPDTVARHGSAGDREPAQHAAPWPVPCRQPDARDGQRRPQRRLGTHRADKAQRLAAPAVAPA